MPPTLPPTADAYAARASHGLFVTGDDFLRVSVLGAGTQAVIVTGRVRQYDGTIKSFRIDVVAPASRAVPATRIASPGCGWIENVTAIAGAAGTGLAQTFVAVDLVRGPEGNGGVLATLIQGFVSSLQRRAWPGSPIQSSLDGPGVLRIIAGTNPAAGAEISETVPAGARWRFLSMTALLTVDATVASRVPVLVFDDGANIFAGVGANFNQTAGTAFTYHWSAGGQTNAQTSVSVSVSTPPNLVLPPGARIRTVTGALQPADDWGAPEYAVEEWMEGA